MFCFHYLRMDSTELLRIFWFSILLNIWIYGVFFCLLAGMMRSCENFWVFFLVLFSIPVADANVS